MSILEDGFQLEEEVSEAKSISECLLVLVSLDVEIWEEAVDVAAALLIVVISAVDANDGRTANLYSSEGEGVSVEGEGFVEGEAFGGRQVEHVVVVGEGEYAHLHVVGCLSAVLLHIIKSIPALQIISITHINLKFYLILDTAISIKVPSLQSWRYKWNSQFLIFHHPIINPISFYN